jgi:hypothetical protein
MAQKMRQKPKLISLELKNAMRRKPSKIKFFFVIIDTVG